MDMASHARHVLDDRTTLRPFLRRQTAGRPLPVPGSSPGIGGGKSGLHGNTVPANGRRGRPQGQCHRKQTARARSTAPRARAKRCGKSAPRPWQQGRQGKPHREQDRIGAAAPQGAGTFPFRRPGWSREARREARPRGMVAACGPVQIGPHEQNPAYRSSGLFPRALKTFHRFVHRNGSGKIVLISYCPPSPKILP